VLESLRAEVVDLLEGGQWEHGWLVYDLEKLTVVEVEHLVERGLMTPGFAEGTGEGRGFAVYGEGQASLEINGLDHLRVLGFRDGDCLGSLWSLASALDDRLETALSYAFDARWGYLSSASETGGQWDACVRYHAVAGLMLTGRLARWPWSWSARGWVCRRSGTGRWRGPGLQRCPQGKPEAEILEQLSGVCAGIVGKERSVRKILLREDHVQTRDQIGRALGRPAGLVDAFPGSGEPNRRRAGGQGARSGGGFGFEGRSRPSV